MFVCGMKYMCVRGYVYVVCACVRGIHVGVCVYECVCVV